MSKRRKKTFESCFSVWHLRGKHIAGSCHPCIHPEIVTDMGSMKRAPACFKNTPDTEHCRRGERHARIAPGRR